MLQIPQQNKKGAKVRSLSQAKGLKEVKPIFQITRHRPEEDNDSMENNTNLDWMTGQPKNKKQRTEITVTEKDVFQITGSKADQMETQPFIEHSLFMIDQLKGEYCREKEGGWLEVKDAISERSEEDEHMNTKESSQPIRTGKWSSEEHELFLEGIREYGKDWAAIQKHVGTRSTRNVVSHGQKFLVRLVRFLEGGNPIKELSLDDAEYFYGILNQKVLHWSAKRKQQRQQEKAELEEKGFVFKTEKAKHQESPKQPLQFETGSSSNEGQDAFSQWRAKFNQEGTELKYSVLQDREADKLTFKASYHFEADTSDNDSAESQSSRHMRRFSVNEESSTFINAEFFHRFCLAFTLTLTKKPDLPTADLEARMMWRAKPGLEFDFYDNQPLKNLFSTNYHHDDRNWEAMRTHPNLLAFLTNELKKKIDTDVHKQDEEELPMWNYLNSLDEDEKEELLNKPLDVYFKPIGGQGQAELDLSKMDLDKMCTNFGHNN